MRRRPSRLDVFFERIFKSALCTCVFVYAQKLTVLIIRLSHRLLWIALLPFPLPLTHSLSLSYLSKSNSIPNAPSSSSTFCRCCFVYTPTCSFRPTRVVLSQLTFAFSMKVSRLLCLIRNLCCNEKLVTFCCCLQFVSVYNIFLYFLYSANMF